MAKLFRRPKSGFWEVGWVLGEGGCENCTMHDCVIHSLHDFTSALDGFSAGLAGM